MRSLVLKSPAKINLFLKVLNKRPDGYHNIVTLFERINLFDDISFKANSSGRIKITCNHPQVPTGPKNLVYKIAQLLKTEHKLNQGVDIHINKRIPVAAGLAGGSSNAATALLGLNKIWNLRLPKAKLVHYAGRIGSDVAFFLYDCPWALGTGRGEKIREVSLASKLWHILVVPKVKLYASEVYGALKLGLTKRNDDVNILIHHLRKNDFEALESRIQNDLEDAVSGLYPGILTLKKNLNSLNTHGVMVSGSGPAVFGLIHSERAAQQIRSKLSRRYSQVFVVRTF